MEKKSSRKLARISLIIMGLGFIVTFPFQETIWGKLLHGGFEAGLVGGLADWFAVTALFRHPLGLPIPHTALLPRNRDRMVNGLVTVLKKDWLSKESIQEKVKHFPFTEKITYAVRGKMKSENVKNAMVTVAQQAIKSVDVKKMTPLVKEQISSFLSDAQMKQMLQLISAQLIKEEVDKKALDHALTKAEIWVKKEETAYQLGEISMNVLNKVEANGMLQFAIRTLQNIMTEEKLGQIVQNLLISGMRSLKMEHEPNRKSLIQYIRKEMEALPENEKVIAGIDNWKDRLLTTTESDDTIVHSLQVLREKVIVLLADEAFIDGKVLPVIEHLLTKMEENAKRIDPWIIQQITILVEANHDQIGTLVKENLDKLDNETLVDMVENNVGKDLQWIRVNGAVCGFIIGLILATFKIVVGLF